MCIQCISELKHDRSSCKYVSKITQWTRQTFLQITKLLDGHFLMQADRLFHTNYSLSKPDLESMMELCHCRAFSVNLKGLLVNIRNYYSTKNKLPTFFSGVFNEAMNSIFKSFFVRLSYKDGTFFLYRDEAFENEGISLSYFSNNEYLSKQLRQHRASLIQSEGRSDAFLLVQPLILLEYKKASFDNKKSKQSKNTFSDAEEIIGRLFDLVENNIDFKNGWIKFKNHYPVRKNKEISEKALAGYSNYRKTLDVNIFLKNSSTIFESIKAKSSSLNILEALQSLISSFVSFYLP